MPGENCRDVTDSSLQHHHVEQVNPHARNSTDFGPGIPKVKHHRQLAIEQAGGEQGSHEADDSLFHCSDKDFTISLRKHWLPEVCERVVGKLTRILGLDEEVPSDWLDNC